MSNILLVTGTDTGVGKTTVSSLLLRSLHQQGIPVAALKPVETGCEYRRREFFAADAHALWESAGGDLNDADRSCLYRFSLPLAPQAAAEEVGDKIDLGLICETIRLRASAVQLLLVEGAGGILVPISEGRTFADVASETGAAVLVIVGSKLGALNHALLTFELLKRRGIDCLGYVFNDLFASSNGAAVNRTNRSMLARLAANYGVAELAALGYIPSADPYSTDAGIAALSRAVADYFNLASQAMPDELSGD